MPEENGCTAREPSWAVVWQSHKVSLLLFDPMGDEDVLSLSNSFDLSDEVSSAPHNLLKEPPDGSRSGAPLPAPSTGLH